MGSPHTHYRRTVFLAVIYFTEETQNKFLDVMIFDWPSWEKSVNTLAKNGNQNMLVDIIIIYIIIKHVSVNSEKLEKKRRGQQMRREFYKTEQQASTIWFCACETRGPFQKVPAIFNVYLNFDPLCLRDYLMDHADCRGLKNSNILLLLLLKHLQNKQGLSAEHYLKGDPQKSSQIPFSFICVQQCLIHFGHSPLRRANHIEPNHGSIWS